MMLRISKLLVVLLVFGGVLQAQDDDNGPPTRLDKLSDNLNQLKVAVVLDRTTPYFPGETATITVTLTNPTSAPLEIPDPRAPGGSGFQPSMLGGPGTKDKSEWSAFFEPLDLPPDIPSTVIPAGQSLMVTFHPEDKLVYPWELYGEMPTNPGMHRLYYWPGGGHVEFEVGVPVLEASAIVPLQEFWTYKYKDMKEPKTVRLAAMIVAARLNGEHVLFAAQHNAATTRLIEAKEDGTLSGGDTASGAPWVRLATVPSKVTKLSGTADPTGQVTLEYTTEDGRSGKVYLDKSRHPL
jgi:hypothetical protein